MLCRTATLNCGLVISLGLVAQLAVEVNTFSGVFIHSLPVCVPQTKTITLRMTQGIQAWVISLRVEVCWTSPRAIRACSSSSCPSNFQIFLGCQTSKKPVRQIIETTDAATFTTQGPCRFEIRSCGIAKVTPATRIAGQTSIIPLKPTNAQTSQNGTRMQNGVRMRPAMAERITSLKPVTFAKAMIGVPNAPKATGAVLAISESPEA